MALTPYFLSVALILTRSVAPAYEIHLLITSVEPASEFFGDLGM
jgi:hypothetical protein